MPISWIMWPELGFIGLPPIGDLLVFREVYGGVLDELFLGFVVLLVFFIMLRSFGVFSSLLHFMLPRKRAGEEGVAVEEKTDNSSSSNNNNNNSNSNNSVRNEGASLIKKQRIDSDSNANSKVAAVATGANNIVYDGASLIMASANSNPPDIDEDLHSRQLAVYGRETMRKLFASNVLISGMQGLGAEIGKY